MPDTPELNVKSIEMEFDALKKLERDLSDLYKIFLEKTTECENLWSILIKQELRHVQLLENLQNDVVAGIIKLREKRFQIHGINLSIQFIDEKIQNYEKLEEIDILEALEVAYNAENHSIDALVFDIIEETDALEDALNQLRQESIQHRDNISKAMVFYKLPTWKRLFKSPPTDFTD